MSDIEKIKKLRQLTGAGFKDCNSALKESKGDLDKASEILRVKGIAKASKKMSRDAREGVIVVSGDSKKIGGMRYAHPDADHFEYYSENDTYGIKD